MSYDLIHIFEEKNAAEKDLILSRIFFLFNTSSNITKMIFDDKVGFYVVKALDINYVVLLCFVYGVSVAFTLNKSFDYMFSYLKDEEKSVALHIFEFVVCFLIISIFTYIGRNVIEMVPSPLNGIFGLDHLRIKELNSGYIMLFTLYFFSYGRHKFLIIQRKLGIE